MTGSDFRVKRIAAGISGATLCIKVGFGRTKLSEIERGQRQCAADDLLSLDRALSELIRAKDTMRQLAATVGWPAGAG